MDKLGVTAYTIANGSASVTTDAGEIPLYYHMDHMGSSEFLTSDVTQRVTSWTSYDEWGNITHNAVLKLGIIFRGYSGDILSVTAFINKKYTKSLVLLRKYERI